MPIESCPGALHHLQHFQKNEKTQKDIHVKGEGLVPSRSSALILFQQTLVGTGKIMEKENRFYLCNCRVDALGTDSELDMRALGKKFTKNCNISFYHLRKLILVLEISCLNQLYLYQQGKSQTLERPR